MFEKGKFILCTILCTFFHYMNVILQIPQIPPGGSSSVTTLIGLMNWLSGAPYESSECKEEWRCRCFLLVAVLFNYIWGLLSQHSGGTIRI